MYSGNSISVENARTYIDNWISNNNSNPIFRKSMLLPRPNFIKLFIENRATNVLIFFGLDGSNLKVVEKDYEGGDLVLDFTNACPIMCPVISLY